jgi:hypothetical protein
MEERKHNKIDWGEAIVPGLALAFGLAFFFQTRNAPAAVLYWPMIAAFLTGLLGIPIVLRFVVGKSKTPVSQSPKGLASRIREARKPGLVLLSAVSYLAILPYLGFSLCNFLFILVVSRGLGSRKWVQNVFVALGLTVFLHLVLIVLMKMNLPRLPIGPLTI